MVTEKDPLISAENGNGYDAAPESALPTERFDIEKSKSDIHHKEQSEKLTIRRVHFDGSSHISVLLQMYGSVWPKVLPYCLVNALITFMVGYAKVYHGIDVTLEDTGHSFMSILVAFLVVTRAKIAYARFMTAREHLETTYKLCRELVQHVCVLTMHDKSEEAKKWRRDVAYQAVVLLRITMAATEFVSQKESAMVMVGDFRKSLAVPNSHKGIKKLMNNWAFRKRDLSDENFRAPLVAAYSLRAEILKQRRGGCLIAQKQVHPIEEYFLLAHVDKFVNAFVGLKELILTPFPFPLVQMARTFLFVFTFTLPFALVGHTKHLFETALIIFFITYGFIGLEYVSMELDDPFGNDPNDFDDLGMAKMTSEDVYLTIFKSDGLDSAEVLRHQVHERLEFCGALHEIADELDDCYDDVELQIESMINGSSQA